MTSIWLCKSRRTQSSAVPAAFPGPDFLLQEGAVREAVQKKSIFNLLSLTDGEKVDFWLLTDEPFDLSRFVRRQTLVVGNLSLHVSAPEDTILVKLRWAKLSGGSDKQFKDALSVYEVQGAKLDRKYLDRWAKQLGVDDALQNLISAAKVV